MRLSSGEHSWQSRLTHDPRTRIALSLMGELVAALRANDLIFSSWLSGGVQDLGDSVLVELLLESTTRS